MRFAVLLLAVAVACGADITRPITSPPAVVGEGCASSTATAQRPSGFQVDVSIQYTKIEYTEAHRSDGSTFLQEHRSCRTVGCTFLNGRGWADVTDAEFITACAAQFGLVM